MPRSSFLPDSLEFTTDVSRPSVSRDASTPRFARLTPSGRGAVATVVLFGSGAERVAGEVAGVRSLGPDSEPPRPRLGRVGEHSGEEVVVVRKSRESVFLHCHGGTAAVDALEEELLRAGAERAGWREWIRAGSAQSPIAEEAAFALSFASTERTAGILLDQLDGALSREIEAIQLELLRDATSAALGRTERILERLPLGLHLTEPWHVAIAGRPNAGKSSLINALVGYTRAIVHETPGTTRDVVSAQTAFEGFPVMLHDTAGIRDSGGRIEQSGIAKARRRIAESDLTVLLLDGSVPETSDDTELLASFPRAIVAYSKSDLPPARAIPEDALCFSAVGGGGLPDLIQTIVARLVPTPPEPGAAVPFTPEHGVILSGVAAGLRREDIASAREGLDRLH